MGFNCSLLILKLGLIFCFVSLLTHVDSEEGRQHHEDIPRPNPQSHSVPVNPVDPHTVSSHYNHGNYYGFGEEYYEEEQVHSDRDRCLCECNYNRAKETRCGWKLIFKAIAGSGRNVVNDYNNGGDINQDVQEAMEIESLLPYRNKDIINNWYHLYIEEVKMEIWKEGVRKTWFLFDGVGSNPTSWLAQHKLIASPYDDIKEGEFAYFSLAGHSALYRTFKITREYCFDIDGGCVGDCGYAMVSDYGVGGDCTYENQQARPYFIYGQRTDQCSEYMLDEIGIGDRLTISVKLCDIDH